jgi:hypothetical protein
MSHRVQEAWQGGPDGGARGVMRRVDFVDEQDAVVRATVRPVL